MTIRETFRFYRACGFGIGYAAARTIGIPPRYARVFDVRMSRIWFGIIAFAFAFASIGCVGPSPVAPSRTQPETETTVRRVVIPSWHGRPASMPDGSIVTICATQPRVYGHPDGSHTTETDAYIITDGTQCPTIPID